MLDRNRDIVGLVPAAGRARRIAPLPCSKELYPVGFQRIGEPPEPRPRVVSQYLLEKFRKAGITKAYIVLREGKWDIPAYYIDGKLVDMHLAYMVITDSCGPPDTIDRAYPFVENKLVAFGFPDIMFSPEDVFEHLFQHRTTSNADIVLGLLPAHDCKVMDMVEIDEKGRIHSLVLKPAQTHLRYTWVCAVWTSAFTNFMHKFLTSDELRGSLAQLKGQKIDLSGDLPVGAVIQGAIGHGLQVEGVPFPNGTYVDIGSPEDLVKAVQKFCFQ